MNIISKLAIATAFVALAACSRHDNANNTDMNADLNAGMTDLNATDMNVGTTDVNATTDMNAAGNMDMNATGNTDMNASSNTSGNTSTNTL
jgi:hypothetical protein